ncbi:MAG: rhodanese-like domain-containing protein [Proteobacteria bacterium]|nr:rhodanese-like domain-containing protein [Pseudomonadota bacterium]
MSKQYKGDITPQETWKNLSDNQNSILVDVRTFAEWKLVGVPNISELSKQPHFIEWVDFPDGHINENFAKQLHSVAPSLDTPIYFLCRTGVRSIAAAIKATESGYTHCYNILEGFEGKQDEAGHRGKVSGWQGRNLPWNH